MSEELDPQAATVDEAPATNDVPAGTETSEAAPSESSRPLSAPAKADRGGFYWGTGRRKTAVARVRIRPGEGQYQINGRPVDEYFTELRDQMATAAPLKATNTEGRLDVFVNVRGGGYMGQAGAVLLGLSRALKGYDPTLEPVLRENDMLTRDPREVERKKPGQPGARKRFQFSKR